MITNKDIVPHESNSKQTISHAHSHTDTGISTSVNNTVQIDMNTQILEILTHLDVRTVSLESKVDITNLELTDLKSKVLVINEDLKKKADVTMVNDLLEKVSLLEKKLETL